MIKAVIFDMFETLITHYHSPLYFGAQMAADAGIPEEKFQALWRPSEYDRTIGKVTLEEVVEKILKENDCYSEQLLQKIVTKRMRTKEDCFRKLHPEIVPMLSTLKENGKLVGLISNCFSEETDVIRKSELFPYFDAVYLSYEQGVQKPDRGIFKRCMDELSVKAEECLYIGDGGSMELEAARELGMKAVQAVWYLKEGTRQPSKRKENFMQAETPMEVALMANEDKKEFIEIITENDEIWNCVRDYAENCSWRAGKSLANMMDHHVLKDWERVLIAHDKENICGYCVVSKEDCIPNVPYTPYIGYVFVDEAYRGKRLSQKMIEAAMDYLKSVGFEEVYLTSDHVGLYEKYGFEVIDKKMAFWGEEEKIYRKYIK